MLQIDIKEISTVATIPESVFKELGCVDSFYFSKDFLDAFESQNKDITYNYLLFSKNNQPIAIAITQKLDIALNPAVKQIQYPLKLIASIRSLFIAKEFSTTICGNIFLSGNYGVFCKEQKDLKNIIYILCNRLLTGKKKKTNLFFFKDFDDTQNTAARVSERFNFTAFDVEPNMVIDVQWQSFDSYKNRLKSKYRVKLNKADASSNSLEVKTLDAHEIRYHMPRLQELYENVTRKATFNILNLNLETYALLKERFRESILFNIYKKENLIVGFSTAFHYKETLDAHFVGLDYRYNKKYAIYPRMLNDYVRLGINLRVKKINLGRTASEIKSTLGATPDYLKCYVKHKRTVPNLLFKPLLKQLKMKAFKQHSPIKE
ncbi:peptidogalycan biosysnthesis protein [Dokdonia sp. Hel_I_53]|uniref:peptidogalycan biosysnthesis protein n=1 Tax=Dokdonia sp. Hel_I_53 TaxID=1566287 RepID=UPI0011996D40|nr:peptidogalycan biosysnthesis protein [Dokdonia sp. Hel_I_53]TVZ52776.1 peptidoglycan biosynthesis/recognition protein [Dokdonia sp. Hel_I_53]